MNVVRFVGMGTAACVVALPGRAQAPAVGASVPGASTGSATTADGSPAAPPAARDSSGFGTTQFSVVLGGGSGHVTSRFTGVSVPSHLTMLELRWERTVLRLAGLDLRYGAALIPFARLTGQEIRDAEGWSCGGVVPTLGASPPCARPQTPAREATGWGVIPVAVRLVLTPAPWIELFASARAGIVDFDRGAPLADRNALAGLLGSGGGIALNIGAGAVLVAEYDVLQMSNGGMKIDAPAMVTPSVRIGLAWRSMGQIAVAGDSSARSRLAWNAFYGVGSFRSCGADGTASLATITVRRDGRLAGNDAAELRIGIEAVPLAIAMRSGGPRYGRPGVGIADAMVAHAVTVDCFSEWGASIPDIGVGFSPVAMRGIFRSGAHTRGFIDLTGGVLLLTRDFPVPGSRGLNFVIGAGAGLEIATGAAERVVLGYRLQHVSNGYTGQLNPSVNLHSAYIGLSRTR